MMLAIIPLRKRLSGCQGGLYMLRVSMHNINKGVHILGSKYAKHQQGGSTYFGNKYAQSRGSKITHDTRNQVYNGAMSTTRRITSKRSKDGLPWLVYLSLDFFKYFQVLFSVHSESVRIQRRKKKEQTTHNHLTILKHNQNQLNNFNLQGVLFWKDKHFGW